MKALATPHIAMRQRAVTSPLLFVAQLGVIRRSTRVELLVKLTCHDGIQGIVGVRQGVAATERPRLSSTSARPRTPPCTCQARTSRPTSANPAIATLADLWGLAVRGLVERIAGFTGPEVMFCACVAAMCQVLVHRPADRRSISTGLGR